MQSVQKRKHGGGSHTRLFLLIAAAALLLGLLTIPHLLPEEAQNLSQAPASTIVTLVNRTAQDVHSLTIKRGETPVWTAEQTASGVLTLLGEDGFTLTESESSGLLKAASFIQAENVLSEEPAEFADHLADFGLDDPRYMATIVYTDGSSVEMHVGSESADGTWRYMRIVGDDRLFAFSQGSVQALFVNRDTLRTVSQPTLHKARIDRVTLTGPAGVQAQWTLMTDIAAPDAIDHWQITAPFVYPADSEAMTSLLGNIANLRLGAYVCEATPENLTLCGFDEPRLTIDIHMAAGTIGNVDSEGVFVTSDWPDSTLTFVIGGEKSDMIDYVLCGDSIYISSHFTMGVFIDYDVAGTMSRYLLPTALGNLSSLTIEENGSVTEYIVTRTEQVAENNELVYDEEGNIVCDITLTKNGEAADYTAFEAAYSALLPVTVSGLLPETVDAPPHTVYTFTDVDGTVHTVALATFDVLHDAVIVDGHQAFYLIKGGVKLNME